MFSLFSLFPFSFLEICFDVLQLYVSYATVTITIIDMYIAYLVLFTAAEWMAGWMFGAERGEYYY